MVDWDGKPALSRASFPFLLRLKAWPLVSRRMFAEDSSGTVCPNPELTLGPESSKLGNLHGPQSSQPNLSLLYLHASPLPHPFFFPLLYNIFDRFSEKVAFSMSRLVLCLGIHGSLIMTVIMNENHKWLHSIYQETVTFFRSSSWIHIIIYEISNIGTDLDSGPQKSILLFCQKKKNRSS